MSQAIRWRWTRVPTVLGGLALLAWLGGCVITEEGLDENPLSLPDIFPPSKVVASYRQLAKPARAGDDELTEQLGSDEKLKVLRKWSIFTSLYADYGLPEKPRKVRITITEMTSRVSAYGAYSNIRPGLQAPEQYVKIGTHATLDGERLYCVKNKYFIVVRDLLSSPAEQRRAMLINFARSAAGRIPSGSEDIDPVSFLPYENRVTASERLDKEDPLGLNIFTKGAVTALYRDKDKEAKVFIAQHETVGSTVAAFETLKEEMEKGGAKLAPISMGDAGFQGKLFKQTCMIAQRDHVVFGAYGDFDEETMRELLATIDRRVKPILPIEQKAAKKTEESSKEPGE